MHSLSYKFRNASYVIETWYATEFLFQAVLQFAVFEIETFGWWIWLAL